MTATIIEAKTFEPGTTGWTVDDLNDAEIERQWFAGRYEIVEGVLTTMPPAYFDGSLPMGRLTRMVERHLDRAELPGDFATEVDFVVARRRVVRVDVAFLTPDDRQRQQRTNAERGRQKLKYGRLLVPPTLVMESLSLGHEAHDEETKLQWYEEFGVPNYWMLNAYAKTLRCLVFENGNYRIDHEVRDADELRPSLFPGLLISLKDMWGGGVHEDAGRPVARQTRVRTMPRMMYPMNRYPFACVTALVMTSTILVSSAGAQTGAELLIRPFEKDENFELNTSALFQDQGEDDFGGDLQISVYEVSGRAREVREKAIPRFGYELVYLDIDSDLGDAGILPERLSDQSVAAGLALPDLYGFVGGLTVGVGYAGDGPFGDANAWYGKATAAFGKKLDENTDLGIFLDYDGNRTYLPDVPLPGFAYRKRVDEKLILVAGVPLSTVEWKPDDRWKFEVFWTLIDSFDARVTYTVAPGFNVFANLDSRRYAFHLDELEGGNDRLLFQERRAELGVQWEPRKDTRLIVAGGYAFGQAFSTGWDYRDDDEVTEVSDQPYVRAGFEMRF